MPPKKVAVTKSVNKKPVVDDNASTKKKDALALASFERIVDKFYDDVCEGDVAIATHVIASTLDFWGWDEFIPDDVADDLMPYDPIINAFRDYQHKAKKGSDLLEITKKTFLQIINKRVKTLTVNYIGAHNGYGYGYASGHDPEDSKPKVSSSKDLVPQSETYRIMTAWVKGMIKQATKLVANQKKAAKNIPAEKASAAMGKWAWPQERKTKNMPFEQSTKLEEELYDAIKGHFEGDNSITDKVAQKLMNFLEKGMYSDVLHPPQQQSLYRGLPVDISWLAKILGYKNVKDMPAKGVVRKNFTFKPKRGAATSWSHSKTIARDFAGSLDKNYYKQHNRCGLLLHARVEDNPNKFIAGVGGLYKLDSPNEYSQEKETIGLGPIKVFEIQYVRFDMVFQTG